MRANPNQLKAHFKSKLTENEIEELGVNLGAGADHYRAYVGPPFMYDLNGGMQFQFLLDLGMREYSRVLEVGCGSLRLGRFLMMFLLPGRYYGVEPNTKILEEGIHHNLGAPAAENQLIALKRPTFADNSDFDFSFVREPVDFIVAQSIASHTGVKETRELLANVGRVMHEESIAMVTYIRTVNPETCNDKDGWFYPECVMYTDAHMRELARSLGLLAYRTNWPMLNRRPEGLLTTQTPLILTKRPWQPTMAQRLAGMTFQPIDRLV